MGDFWKNRGKQVLGVVDQEFVPWIRRNCDRCVDEGRLEISSIARHEGCRSIRKEAT